MVKSGTGLRTGERTVLPTRRLRFIQRPESVSAVAMRPKRSWNKAPWSIGADVRLSGGNVGRSIKDLACSFKDLQTFDRFVSACDPFHASEEILLVRKVQIWEKFGSILYLCTVREGSRLSGHT